MLLDMAHCYVDIAKKYRHSAIFVQDIPFESVIPLLETIREISGEEYYVMLHGDPTWPIPNGDDMMDFSVRLYEETDKLREESEAKFDEMRSRCDSSDSGACEGNGAAQSERTVRQSRKFCGRSGRTTPVGKRKRRRSAGKSAGIAGNLPNRTDRIAQS